MHILFIKNGSVCPHIKEGYHTGMSDIIGRQAGEGLTLILQHFAFLGSEALEKAPRKRDAIAGVSDWGHRIIIPQFSPPQRTVNCQNSWLVPSPCSSPLRGFEPHFLFHDKLPMKGTYRATHCAPREPDMERESGLR